MLKYEAHVTGPFAENTYFLLDDSTGECAIIDPGQDALAIWRNSDFSKYTLKAIWLTHAHLDHIWGLGELHEAFPDVPIHMHKLDMYWIDNYQSSAKQWGFEVEAAPVPTDFFEDGDQVSLGEHNFSIWHTPGHAPGHVCIGHEDFVLVGDLIFSGSIGRTDFPQCSLEQLEKSVQTKIYCLPDDRLLLSGHGPATTVGKEKATNPFVRPLS